ncbi:hypothetical protein D3C84_1074750 [compost metagenome]
MHELAAIRGFQTRQHLQQRGLACAVHADKADALLLVQGERDIIEQHLVAIGFGNIDCAKYIHPCTGSMMYAASRAAVFTTASICVRSMLCDA